MAICIVAQEYCEQLNEAALSTLERVHENAVARLWYHIAVA